MVAYSKVFVGLQDKDSFWLKLDGDVRVPWCVSLETYCEAVIKQSGIKSVYVDLVTATNLDSTTLGVLAKVAVYTQKYCGQQAVLFCLNEDIQRLIISMGFSSVFDIQHEFGDIELNFEDLPILDCTENDIKDVVIAAHKALMELTEDNRACFGGLVESLERVRP
tara:strand:- start:5560 stop:6054 length:495 start_codon:yes stop_codon:yes gene_type:complete